MNLVDLLGELKALRAEPYFESLTCWRDILPGDFVYTAEWLELKERLEETVQNSRRIARNTQHIVARWRCGFCWGRGIANGKPCACITMQIEDKTERVVVISFERN